MTSYQKAAMRQLLDASRIDADRVERAFANYRSKFGRWNDRATVRAVPRRVFAEQEPGRLFFPPELCPGALHPAVISRGPDAVHELLVHRLYTYLHFTIELEALAVIPIASALSRNRAGVPLSGQLRMDAYKIATDEAWHAQFTFDLMRQVELMTGITCQAYAPPTFVRTLDHVREQLPSRVRGLEGLIFAIVSETLISSILAELPRDPRLPDPVREMVADHALDEGRHHSYFRDLLFAVWPSLSQADRTAIGPWLPEMIRAFLAPDVEAIACSLAAIGLDTAEIHGVLEESLPPELVTQDIAFAARSAVRYFTQLGSLKDPATLEAFTLSGLLDVRVGGED